MKPLAGSESMAPTGLGVPIGLGLAKLILHLAANLLGGYGYFRDELYYIACSNHLAAGYVDQPPLSIFILAANRALFGDSLFALRLLPAVAGALTVFLTGVLARELGGGRLAQGLACAASFLSLVGMSMNSFYSMNSFDILLWTLTAYLLIRLIKSGNPGIWILLGLVLGLGLLNKIGVLWLGLGILAGLLATPERRWLRTRWPWLAGVIALGLFAPFIVWNLRHDLAHLEFVRNATLGKYSGLGALSFVLGQVLQQNPPALPLWLAGLFFYLFSREGRPFRALGYIYLTAFAILLLNGHSKAEYLSPAYGMLFAAGGRMLEIWSARPALRWARAAYPVLLATGLALAPLAMPILPVRVYTRYADVLGVAPGTSERKELADLPQFFADMFGWEEKAAAVAGVYRGLSPEDRKRCAIFADNYGRSAAIDFFGKKYGLPPSVGRHNNYWIWGPRGYTGECVIILGGDLEDKQELFQEVDIVGVAPCNHCMPYEKDLRIYLCRGLKVPLSELWPRMKHYD